MRSSFSLRLLRPTLLFFFFGGLGLVRFFSLAPLDAEPPSLRDKTRLPPGLFPRGLFAWKPSASADTLETRFPPPPGSHRPPLPQGSFGQWLRSLPLLPPDTPVSLFDGRLKPRQDVHAAVIDLDIGPKDLQQCADAIMRLWGEYLWSRGLPDLFDIHLGGQKHPWERWKRGDRLLLRGRSLRWLPKRSAPSASYKNFRRYLDHTMAWANTTSLTKQLTRVPIHRARPGDLLLVGWKEGQPGHAVLLLDHAIDSQGRSFFLLGQSYMPAQNFHLLRAPGQISSPWYRFPSLGPIRTPEWNFTTADLFRLPLPSPSR